MAMANSMIRAAQRGFSRNQDAAQGEGVQFDSASFTEAEIELEANAAVEEWLSTTPDDLEDGETLADRLLSLLIGIADLDGDEPTDDEADVIEMIMEAAGDVLDHQGVDESDIDAVLNEQDEDAAERIQDLLATAFDSVAFDAAYRKKRAVRNGKKVWVKKRVSGTVRLSGKQKLALKKAQRKAHSGTAKMKRMKSMRLAGK